MKLQEEDCYGKRITDGILKECNVSRNKKCEIEQEREDLNKAKDSELRNIVISAPFLREPEKPNIPTPDYRPETEYEINRELNPYKRSQNVAWIPLFLCTAVFLILAIVLFVVKAFIPGLICIVIGIIPVFLRKRTDKSKKEFVLNRIRQENDEKRREYDKKVRDAEERYNRDKKTYDSKIQNIKEKNEEAKVRNRNAAIARDELKPVISELNKNLAEAKKKLQEYYDLDIIFGKYRGLVPVSMMYEYLASSRCSSLEGPDGAYNLYEAEIRQNIIIVQLQTIISQLESIKQNQYCLYQQLKEIEGNTREMNNSLNRISRDLDRIKDISAYSASVQTQTMYMTANIKKQLDNIHGLQIASFFLK